MTTSATAWTPLTVVSVCPRIPSDLARRNEPVTVGVPFPRGVLFATRDLEVRSHGQSVPLQARPLERWDDGSIRWALLDLRVNVSQAGAEQYLLGVGAHLPDAVKQPASTAPSTTALAIDAGPWTLRVSLPPEFRFRFLANPATGDAAALADAVLEIRDEDDRPWPIVLESAVIEESGPLRVHSVMRGRARNPRGRGELHVTLRADIFPGLPIVRCDVTIGNPDRSRHRGGIWELGDPGSVRLRDFSFSLRLPGTSAAAVAACSTGPGLAPEDCGQRLELYQDSSGRPRWQSINHVNGKGEVPTRFGGFRLRGSAVEREGLAAAPVVQVRRSGDDVALAAPEFWQNFPKAIEASATGITLRLFPRQFGDAHEVQGGEQKTHRFWLVLGTDPITSAPLDWTRNPLVAAAEPEWYCAAEGWPFLTPASTDGGADPRAALVNQALDGEHAFESERDVIDEYGWRNFGDIYANHEAVGQSGAAPFVSHYNNQYDAIAGLAGQFMATGDRRWWGLMDELARHVVDIDVYRTTRDKAAFNGGLFWHTYHYVAAGRSTHRSYPNAPRVGGGGPSNEHNYTAGLALHYLMTGDTASRDTAVMLADWVVDMDDGDLTVFRWLTRGRTGLASQTADTVYHGPGRGAGNSVAALLTARRLTGDRRYQEKAEEIIRRCVHPADDIDRLDLLDAERRWSYVVFLQQLGKYLLDKAERGELDAAYAYARQTLLHYARWMADREYPYLDKPEILEYPNETWPAQDIRKSDVFYLAAAHAAGVERERFVERARYFFDHAVSALSGMATRWLARPVVIIMTNGLAHAWFVVHPGFALPPPTAPSDFGPPVAFVPQRATAIRRAKSLLVIGALGGLAAATLLALTLWR
jgi:hypothetical protein